VQLAAHNIIATLPDARRLCVDVSILAGAAGLAIAHLVDMMNIVKPNATMRSLSRAIHNFG